MKYDELEQIKRNKCGECGEKIEYYKCFDEPDLNKSIINIMSIFDSSLLAECKNCGLFTKLSYDLKTQKCIVIRFKGTVNIEGTINVE